MKSCAGFKEELAVCATARMAPSPATTAHLARCAQCQTAFAELNAAAALQTDTAAHLSTPARRINLEARFLEMHGRRSTILRGWRPSFLGAAALVAILIFSVLLFSRRSPNTAPPLSSVVQMPTQETDPARANPTWQTYRQELRSEGDALTSNDRVGTMLSHYRMKDAYFEMN